MKNIQKTLTDLFDLQKFAIKLGLENISKLTNYFNNPHIAYPTIHIAGTNGKGSTAIILQNILMEHGLNVGLFTSPHLVRFNERIRVNNDLIDDNFIEYFWVDIKNLVLQLKATFFDTTTCLAFEYFNQKNVDIAIFETGLGGRLDSTNIINPELAIITPIDFDHQKQLGSTLRQIASEKAGIIKNNCPVFLSKQEPEVTNYFKSEFDKQRLIFIEEQVSDLTVYQNSEMTVFDFFDKSSNKIYRNLQLNLLGLHQAENACLAYLSACHYLKNCQINFKNEAFQKALSQVSWPGRIQKISEKPKIYLDVSHNEAGIKQTLNFIKSNFKESNLKLLLGLLEDKDYKSIVNLLKNVFSEIWITEPENIRKLPGDILQKEFLKHGISANFIKDIKKSFESLIGNLRSEDTLFIMGSHYLAGTIKSMKE